MVSVVIISPQFNFPAFFCFHRSLFLVVFVSASVVAKSANPIHPYSDESRLSRTDPPELLDQQRIGRNGERHIVSHSRIFSNKNVLSTQWFILR